MTDEEGEKKFLVVVGMNRPRLSKILSLVEERNSELCSDDASLSVTVVPCLAALGSYNDENGNAIRYLSNVVCLDGSPMTTYLDDVTFRDNLDSVLLVGYEWQLHDNEKIQDYFHANQLDVSVTCVNANQEFNNLHEEMEAFKILDDEAKALCLSDGSMGPGKMAKAIVDAISQIHKQRDELQQQDMEKANDQVTQHQQQQSEEIPVAVEEELYEREPPDSSRPVYACRMCRTILFGENHLVQDHVQNLHSFKKLSHTQSTPASKCQSLFCNDGVLQWLSPSGEEIEGKLTCPRCAHKIGHWRWAGAQCSCGTWVTPAIQIPYSKVDIIPPASTYPAVDSVGVINPLILSSTTLDETINVI